MPNLRIELSSPLNDRVPLDLAKFPGIEPLWKYTVGDCSDKYNELMSKKTSRNCCIYIPMSLLAYVGANLLILSHKIIKNYTKIVINKYSSGVQHSLVASSV
jgi:hypothetical protein